MSCFWIYVCRCKHLWQSFNRSITNSKQIHIELFQYLHIYFSISMEQPLPIAFWRFSRHMCVVSQNSTELIEAECISTSKQIYIYISQIIFINNNFPVVNHLNAVRNLCGCVRCVYLCLILKICFGKLPSD